MKRKTTYWAVLLLTAILLLVIGMVPAAAVQEAPSPGDESKIVFADNFSKNVVGVAPSDWEIDRPAHVEVRVVSDEGVPSGRALHVKGIPSRRTDSGVLGPFWDPTVDDATTIAIQFKLRHVRGSVNSYVMTPPMTPSVHWRVNPDGRLTGFGSSASAPLEHGWNDVRLVADRVRNQVFIYLNDMQTPVIGPLNLRSLPNSWEGAHFRFWNVIDEDTAAEFYIADVKAWVVD